MVGCGNIRPLQIQFLQWFWLSHDQCLSSGQFLPAYLLWYPSCKLLPQVLESLWSSPISVLANFSPAGVYAGGLFSLILVVSWSPVNLPAKTFMFSEWAVMWQTYRRKLSIILFAWRILCSPVLMDNFIQCREFLVSGFFPCWHF